MGRRRAKSQISGIENLEIPKEFEFLTLLQWLVCSESAEKYELPYYGEVELSNNSTGSVAAKPGSTIKLGVLYPFALIAGFSPETIKNLLMSFDSKDGYGRPIPYKTSHEKWIQLASVFQAFEKHGNPIVHPHTKKTIVFHDKPGDPVYCQLRRWYETPFIEASGGIEVFYSDFIKAFNNPSPEAQVIVPIDTVEEIKQKFEALANKQKVDSSITQSGDKFDRDVQEVLSKLPPEHRAVLLKKLGINMCVRLSELVQQYMEAHGLADAQQLADHLLETVSKPSEQFRQLRRGNMAIVFQTILDDKIPDKKMPDYHLAIGHLSSVLSDPITGEPFCGRSEEMLKLAKPLCAS